MSRYRIKDLRPDLVSTPYPNLSSLEIGHLLPIQKAAEPENPQKTLTPRQLGRKTSPLLWL